MFECLPGLRESGIDTDTGKLGPQNHSPSDANLNVLIATMVQKIFNRNEINTISIPVSNLNKEDPQEIIRIPDKVSSPGPDNKNPSLSKMVRTPKVLSHHRRP